MGRKKQQPNGHYCPKLFAGQVWYAPYQDVCPECGQDLTKKRKQRELDVY